jgi:hypothetical protein
MSLLLKTVYEEVTRNAAAQQQKVIWVNDQPTQDDLDHIMREGSSVSEFDSNNLRNEVLRDLQAKRAKLITKRCLLGKVLAVVYPDQEARIPWDIFGKIFAAFGPSHGKTWRFVWFANKKPRILPASAEKPGAGHMNGGYTYSCDPSAVVVYREEEVARVLVHELLHAACTDAKDDMIELVEAKTETWAEIFLIAILSAGKPRMFSQLWKTQAQWIADQEYVLKNDHEVQDPTDYAWRYTLGRRFVLEGFGIRLPGPSADPRANIGGSMRFTSPAIC